MDLIRRWLAPYAAVLFARDPLVGALVLAATLLDPRVGGSGLLAVALSLGAARLARLPDAAVAEGLYGYNALLVGLAVGAWFPVGPAWAALLVLGVAGAVALTASLRDAAARSGLPPLTLPFLAVALLIAPLGARPAPPPAAGALAIGLEALGTLLFVPRPLAGLLVLAGIVRWSRIGALLGAVGAVVGLAVPLAVPVPEDLRPLLVLNAALAAIALGGVWSVPSPSAFALAALGAGLASAGAAGLAPILERLGLPVLIAPFVAVTWGGLLALRQRSEDRDPKSVDFLPGTPEENLRYWRTRVARFGARYGVRLRAPVRGTWVVTQSEGDGPTHQGSWWSALDLEVAGEDGRVWRGDGSRDADHLCWHLPVLAAADGVVAKVVDGVRDNPVGQVELADNWGNVVVVWHGVGLHSLVAHLSPGTLRVVEGQRVRRGEVLGLCGSSGRSPRPHVHFQLQATGVVGAPTLPVELHDVVRDGESPALIGAWTPRTGDALRNLDPGEPSRGAQGWVPALPFALVVEDGVAVTLVPEIDPYGRRVLRCGTGALFYAVEDDLITVLDVLAPRGSVLHLLRDALPRLPLALGPTTPEWTDPLPAPSIAAPLRPLLDLVEPFRAPTGLEVRYTARREGAEWVVEGRSTRAWRGAPAVRTEARLHPSVGLISVERTLRGHTVRAARRE